MPFLITYSMHSSKTCTLFVQGKKKRFSWEGEKLSTANSYRAQCVACAVLFSVAPAEVFVCTQGAGGAKDAQTAF